MTYTYNDIQEIILKAQCCFPLITYNIILAGKTGNPCIEILKLQNKMLQSYMDALKRYKPVGYEYEVNDEVFYTELEDDYCLTTDELQSIIEGIRSICQCSNCIDKTELLTDI